jgi:hypothetical protein
MHPPQLPAVPAAHKHTCILSWCRGRLHLRMGPNSAGIDSHALRCIPMNTLFTYKASVHSQCAYARLETTTCIHTLHVARPCVPPRQICLQMNVVADITFKNTLTRSTLHPEAKMQPSSRVAHLTLPPPLAGRGARHPLPPPPSCRFPCCSHQATPATPPNSHRASACQRSRTPRAPASPS